MLFHTWTFAIFLAIVLPVFFLLRKTRFWIVPPKMLDAPKQPNPAITQSELAAAFFKQPQRTD